MLSGSVQFLLQSYKCTGSGSRQITATRLHQNAPNHIWNFKSFPGVIVYSGPLSAGGSTPRPLYQIGKVKRWQLGIYLFRTDWAPAVLFLPQPIQWWRWRAWPMNASCNWVDSLQVSSVCVLWSSLYSGLFSATLSHVSNWQFINIICFFSVSEARSFDQQTHRPQNVSSNAVSYAFA